MFPRNHSAAPSNKPRVSIKADANYGTNQDYRRNTLERNFN